MGWDGRSTYEHDGYGGLFAPIKLMASAGPAPSRPMPASQRRTSAPARPPSQAPPAAAAAPASAAGAAPGRTTLAPPQGRWRPLSVPAATSAPPLRLSTAATAHRPSAAATAAATAAGRPSLRRLQRPRQLQLPPPSSPPLLPPSTAPAAAAACRPPQQSGGPKAAAAPALEHLRPHQSLLPSHRRPHPRTATGMAGGPPATPATTAATAAPAVADTAAAAGTVAGTAAGDLSPGAVGASDLTQAPAHQRTSCDRPRTACSSRPQTTRQSRSHPPPG